MTHYPLRWGLKKFESQGEEAVMKEFLQLHNKETFPAERLTEEQKKDVLDSLVFLKEKRDFTVKG